MLISFVEKMLGRMVGVSGFSRSLSFDNEGADVFEF